jgi:hypothetical protein
VSIKGKGAKLTIVFLAVVLALAGVGAGFAHWSSTVTITETVNTGTLLIGLTEFTCAEMYEFPEGIYNQGEWEGKDVADISCEYDQSSFVTGQCGSGYSRANVTITNAYPSLRGHVTYRVKNLGSIPVIMETIVISDPSGELDWHNVNSPAPSPSEQFLGCLYRDINGNGQYDDGEEVICFWKVNNIGTQLHCGDSVKSEIDLHVEQDATEQGHTYHVQIEIMGIQWNLSQWPP